MEGLIPWAQGGLRICISGPRYYDCCPGIHSEKDHSSLIPSYSEDERNEALWGRTCPGHTANWKPGQI